MNISQKYIRFADSACSSRLPRSIVHIPTPVPRLQEWHWPRNPVPPQRGHWSVPLFLRGVVGVFWFGFAASFLEATGFVGASAFACSALAGWAWGWPLLDVSWDFILRVGGSRSMVIVIVMVVDRVRCGAYLDSRLRLCTGCVNVWILGSWSADSLWCCKRDRGDEEVVSFYSYF